MVMRRQHFNQRIDAEFATDAGADAAKVPAHGFNRVTSGNNLLTALDGFNQSDDIFVSFSMIFLLNSGFRMPRQPC